MPLFRRTGSGDGGCFVRNSFVDVEGTQAVVPARPPALNQSSWWPVSGSKRRRRASNSHWAENSAKPLQAMSSSVAGSPGMTARAFAVVDDQDRAAGVVAEFGQRAEEGAHREQVAGVFAADRQVGRVDRHAGRLFLADDSAEGPHVVSVVEVGKLGRQLEIVERLERQAAGRTDAAGDRLQGGQPRFAGEKQRAARLGDGEVAEERRAAGERNQQVGRERRFERFERAEDAAGLGGGQDTGDQVASLELARVELGCGVEREPLVVRGVQSVDFSGCREGRRGRRRKDEEPSPRPSPIGMGEGGRAASAGLASTLRCNALPLLAGCSPFSS